MHDLVMRIKEPDLCYVFARNAIRQGHPELALQAHRRAVELRADEIGADSGAELAALRAIFAYEEALSYNKGRRTRATGTWQMVKRYGLLSAVSRRAASGGDAAVDAALHELGLEDYSFTAVLAAYPAAFTANAA